MSTSSLFPSRHLLCLALVVAFGSVVLPIAAFGHEKVPAGAQPAVSAHSAKNAAPSRNAEERLISLVVLLESPRHLDEHSIATAVGDALKIDFSHDRGAQNSVVAQPPYYRIKLATGSYVINDIAERYVDASDQAVDDIAEPRLRDAVAKHRAWISIDWAATDEPTDVLQAYQQIGKIAVALAGPQAVAIYSPEVGRFSLYTDNAARALAGNDPLAVFVDPSADVGVVSVRDDDPNLRLAVAEAHKYWPDFVDAFRNKQGENFSVKGRIAEGTAIEHMWISVSAIDGNKVHGTLDNVPTALTHLKMGQDLHITLDDVEDWLYLDASQETIGGFTQNVLEQATQSAAR